MTATAGSHVATMAATLTGTHCTPIANARLARSVGMMPMPMISAMAPGEAKPSASSPDGTMKTSTAAPISKP